MFLNVNFLKNSQTKWFKQSHCFLPKLQKGLFYRFLFIFKQNSQGKGYQKFYHWIACFRFFGSFNAQGQLQSAQAPAMGLCWLNLKNITLFQRKLNELPQEVSLPYKFCLTIHMKYFEVLILVFFKCQLIAVLNSLNKSIAFFQKCKKVIFSELSPRFVTK